MSSASVGALAKQSSGEMPKGVEVSSTTTPNTVAQEELVEETARLITEVQSEENTSGEEAVAVAVKGEKGEGDEKSSGGASLFMIQVGTLIFYITADVMKNLAENLALKGSIVNASWLLVMYSIVNLILAPSITFFFDRTEGLKRMINLQSIKNFFIPACLFGLQSCCMVLQNKFLPASTKKVLSQIRIPLTAVFSMFLTGAKYTGLQWLIIMSILCGIVLFQVISTGGKSIFEGDADTQMVPGLFLALLANLAAVLGSLTSERFLKAEKGTPFYMQKFQIEVTQLLISALCYVAIVPYVIGGLYYLIFSGNPDKRDNIMKSQSPFYWRQDISTVTSSLAFPLTAPSSWDVFDDSTIGAQEALMEISRLKRKLSMWPELDLSPQDGSHFGQSRLYTGSSMEKNGYTEFTPYFSLSTQSEGTAKFPVNDVKLHAADVTAVRERYDGFQSAKGDKKEKKKWLKENDKNYKETKEQVKNTYWQTNPGHSATKMFTSLETLAKYAKNEQSYFTSYPYGNKIVTAYEDEITKAFTLSIPAVKKQMTVIPLDGGNWRLDFEEHLHGAVFHESDTNKGLFTKTKTISTKFLKTTPFEGSDIAAFETKKFEFLFQVSGNKVYVHFVNKELHGDYDPRTDTTPQADEKNKWWLVLDCANNIKPDGDARAPSNLGGCALLKPTKIEDLKTKKSANYSDLKYSNIADKEERSIPAGVTPGLYGAGSDVGGSTVCDEDLCSLEKDEWYQFAFMGTWTKWTKFPFQSKKVTSKDDNPASWGVHVTWTRSPFAGWSCLTIVAMFFNICQSWSSGLIVKVLSSLMKNISAALALVLIILIEYLLMWSPQKQASVSFFNLFIATCGVFIGAVSFVLAPKPPKDVIEKKEGENENENSNESNRETSGETQGTNTESAAEEGTNQQQQQQPTQTV